jgi:hypothetical protein
VKQKPLRPEGKSVFFSWIFGGFPRKSCKFAVSETGAMVGGYSGLGNAADCRTCPAFGVAKTSFSRQIQESIDTFLTNDNNSHCDLTSKQSCRR